MKKTETIDDVQFEHKYATVNDIQIHYLIAGDGRHPVLLIHGFPGSWLNWKPLMGILVNEGYTAVVPDFRGAGESSLSASGYDKKTMAQDLHALMQSLGYKKASIVGHDIGLCIAYSYAAQFQEETKKIILMDAFFPGITGWEQPYDGRPGKWHFRFYGEYALKLVKGRERIYLDMFWDDFVVKGNATVPETDRKALAEDYAKPGHMEAGFMLYATWITNDIADNQAYAKKKLDIPVLSIGGDHSRGKTLAGQIPLITENPQSLILENCGHWVLEEKNAETTKAILNFLSQP